MTFHDFIGHDDAKLALILNALDPRCGGVLFAGERGCGKSTLSRYFLDILPPGIPVVNLPLNTTEDALLGGIDVDFLCRASEDEVRQRTRKTLEICMPGGGYCLGTGNSVANYIPVNNYLAMLDEGRKYMA